jgi:hypothetical protein
MLGHCDEYPSGDERQASRRSRAGD